MDFSLVGSETRREVSGDFQVDLQDQACCRWQHRDVQSLICGLEDSPSKREKIMTRHLLQ
jgi:hypothetical protein